MICIIDVPQFGASKSSITAILTGLCHLPPYLSVWYWLKHKGMGGKTYESTNRSRLIHFGFFGLNFMNLSGPSRQQRPRKPAHRETTSLRIDCVLVEQNVRDGSHAHGRTGVARVRLRGRIDLVRRSTPSVQCPLAPRRDGGVAPAAMAGHNHHHSDTASRSANSSLARRDTYSEHPDGVDGELVKFSVSHGDGGGGV